MICYGYTVPKVNDRGEMWTEKEYYDIPMNTGIDCILSEVVIRR